MTQDTLSLKGIILNIRYYSVQRCDGTITSHKSQIWSMTDIVILVLTTIKQINLVTCKYLLNNTYLYVSLTACQHQLMMIITKMSDCMSRGYICHI